jgi:hypothetical protein
MPPRCTKHGQAFHLQPRRALIILLKQRDMAQMVERPGCAKRISQRSTEGETLFQERSGSSGILLYDRDLPQGVQSHDDAVVVTEFPVELEALLQPGAPE